MSTRINFHKNVQMHLACAKDNSHPAMEYIFFKSGFAYASNGYILVKNDLRCCSDLDQDQIVKLDGKVLHANHYKNILKYDTIKVSNEGIEAKKEGDRAFFYFSTNENFKYPNVEKTLNEALNRSSVPMPQVGLNAKFIESMYKSLCTSGHFKFTFKGENQPIICENIDSDYLDCIGVIMPMYIE